MARRPHLKAALAGAAFLALTTNSGLSSARRNGIGAPGCEGCHSASGASASVTANPASFSPSADVTFSVVISGGPGRTTTSAGVFVPQPAVGSLYAIAGEGLTLTTDGLVHLAPKTAQGGVVTFRFGWRAPATAAGLNLDVFALSANGDGRSTGDAAGNATFRAVFGCAPKEYYYDGDSDGFGSADFPSVLGCDGQPASNTSVAVGDCNDNDAKVFPEAKEVCNGRDDDCDGAIDEETAPTQLYPDDDGDGYYARNPVGPALLGCVPLRGYAAQGGDCAPKDPLVFPGAAETCNAIDDNCDGRVDDRLRPQCGIGFCRRESITCEEVDCTPGTPSPEKCNLLDDDCDGEVDEDATCPLGQTCTIGKCSGGGASSTGGAASSAGGTSNGATGGASGAQGGSVTGGGASAAGGSPGSAASSASGGAPSTSGSAGSAGSPSSADPRSGGCTLTPAPARSNMRPAAHLLASLALFALAARKRKRRRGASER